MPVSSLNKRSRNKALTDTALHARIEPAYAACNRAGYSAHHKAARRAVQYSLPEIRPVYSRAYAARYRKAHRKPATLFQKEKSD
jgi:hypothetical protein